jgi:lipopolysaccharide heptosyltransferase II
MLSHALSSPVHADPALWQRARRVLCVRLDAMGDVLMTTPAMRALKRAMPGRALTLLTSHAGAALAPHLGDIDRVLVYDAPWMKQTIAPTADGLQACAEKLRAECFDAAVIFTVYSQSALPAAMLCWLAGIPLRLAHTRENPYHLLSDWVPEREPAVFVRHEVQRQLDLVASVGARTDDTRMVFTLRAEDGTRAMRTLHAAGVHGERDWLVVHPGASAASRRYPVEHYAPALQCLAQQDGRLILITGSAEEAALTQSLATRVPRALSLAGALTLGELACVLDRAALLIANNTGPVHLAAALGTPVVDLYALTNPQHTPWQVPHRVLSHDVPCRYCYRSVCVEGHHACLRGVPPEAVTQAALDLLQETQGTRPAEAMAIAVRGEPVEP